MNPTRSQLYAWVWDTPVARIAQAFNLSGSALAKACKRHRIPTPPRGYWRRRQVGEMVSPTPLPDPGNDYALSVTIDDAVASELGRLRAVEPVALANFRPPARRATARATDADVSAGPRESSAAQSLRDGEKRIGENIGAEGRSDAAAFVLMARRRHNIELALRFLDDVQDAARLYDSATQAVVALRVARARKALSQDPVLQAVESCHQVAVGKSRPNWWLAIQDGLDCF